jgi:hypothetical protein
MALTEQQAGEPLLEFHQYGSLRRVVGVTPFTYTQLPRVSFGVRTGMDDGASVADAATAGSGRYGQASSAS